MCNIIILDVKTLNSQNVHSRKKKLKSKIKRKKIKYWKNRVSSRKRKELVDGSLCNFDVIVRIPDIAGDSPGWPRTSQTEESGSQEYKRRFCSNDNNNNNDDNDDDDDDDDDDNHDGLKYIWNNSNLNCGCRWNLRMIIAVNFQLYPIGKKKPEKKLGL